MHSIVFTAVDNSQGEMDRDCGWKIMILFTLG